MAGGALEMTAYWAWRADSSVRGNSAEVSTALVGSIAGLESYYVHYDLLAWDSCLVQVHLEYRDCPYRHGTIAMIRVVRWGGGNPRAQTNLVPFHAFGAAMMSV